MALSFTNCVSLGEKLALSEPEFLDPYLGEIKPPLYSKSKRLEERFMEELCELLNPKSVRID